MLRWVAALLGGVGAVVLGAVAASGVGPVRSLRRALRSLEEVWEEGERLRRALERFRARAGP